MRLQERQSGAGHRSQPRGAPSIARTPCGCYTGRVWSRVGVRPTGGSAVLEISATGGLAPTSGLESATGTVATCASVAALAGKVRRADVMALVELLGDPHPFVRYEAGVSLARTAQMYRGRPRLGVS